MFSIRSQLGWRTPWSVLEERRLEELLAQGGIPPSQPQAASHCPPWRRQTLGNWPQI